jgi:hypothetical protein
MNWDLAMDAGIITSTLLIGCSDILFYRILGEVNGKSPSDKKFSI